ncbi:MAG: voltage-gated potassium channel [Phycisphaerales bacterium]
MTRDPAHHLRARIFRRSLLLLAGVLVLGTGGYTLTEGWSPWESFFFTIVTITTVGYGDHGVSHNGQVFTAVMMVLGIGSLTYTVGQLVQAAVAFGFDQERNMRRQILNLRNHVIVCGLGRIGTQVCELLDEAGAGFVVIDLSEQKVEQARRRGWIALDGDATDDHLLQDAGIAQARALVSVASRDSDNIVVTLSARSIAPGLDIYSRAEHADSVRKIRRAGATHVVSPVMVGGQKITEAILRPSLVGLLDPVLGGGQAVRLFEIQIEANSPLAGRTIDQIGAAHREVVFVAMAHEDGTVGVRPEPSQTLSPGQTYVIAGCEHDVGPFLEEVGLRAA